ncbi:MAG: DUF177 domain-containing protein [Alloprevotella sp.]|nr:DUF177 domain-containing protein [Alloprevotella sp.]
MPTEASIYIDLQKEAAEGTSHKEVILDDAFFGQLEQDEIRGGNVTATYSVSKPNSASTKIEIELSGQVKVACDRCLNDLNLDVDFADESTFASNSEEQAFYYTDARHPGLFNLGWYLYESIVTSLPIERFHEQADCDADMTRLIISEKEE